MAILQVIYKTPKDPAAFDKYYFETHVPMASKIPGLRRYQVSRGAVMAPGGPSGVHLVATLHFDDLASIGGAFGSPEGQAAAADVATFATGGVDMFMFEQTDL